ncbi:L-rhamnose mutarotase [Embleya scabrispora]|uniref:L-rhamnose mutarotase n=1 Tax=Embleya scabrispora TaxID=159449 RepID=UPI00036ADD84|nr:L-rhamnose mutarotase [Embleya scabrispora]MYS87750.1 L-rhamnose mutarotase [Streptomyces sp. SID5474]
MERRVRRTRLRPGRQTRYRLIHARVPDRLADALRDAGVQSWEIWCDGLSLIHIIDCVVSYDATMAHLSAYEPDPTWDELIAECLDPAPEANTSLQQVWYLNSATQGPG